MARSRTLSVDLALGPAMCTNAIQMLPASITTHNFRATNMYEEAEMCEKEDNAIVRKWQVYGIHCAAGVVGLTACNVLFCESKSGLGLQQRKNRS